MAFSRTPERRTDELPIGRNGDLELLVPSRCVLTEPTLIVRLPWGVNQNCIVLIDGSAGLGSPSDRR